MSALAEMGKVFADSFLQPECYMGEDIESEIMEAGLDLEHGKVYCRLSASGYLDCTDWSGPYDTVEEAAQALIDMYGDDY
jgi:hypothetical protein